MDPRNQIEHDIREWIRNHYGVIGYAEALRLGASPRMIQTKLAQAEWIRIHRGVFRHAASARGPWQDLRAAFVATEGWAAVSHASAAWAWGLLPEFPTPPELTVRLGQRHLYRHSGLTIHRSRDLDMSETVNRNGIPVTNPLRTLVDLAGTAAPRDLTAAVDNALATRLVSTAGLTAEIQRRSRQGRNGVAILRRHLADRGYTDAPAPSVLEAHTRRLVISPGLDLPSVELKVGDGGEYRLDLAWADIYFAVEVDGYAWHFSPEHTQRDVTRRNKLQRAGWTLLIYTWRQVLMDPETVAAEIIATHNRLSEQASRSPAAPNIPIQ